MKGVAVPLRPAHHVAVPFEVGIVPNLGRVRLQVDDHRLAVVAQPRLRGGPAAIVEQRVEPAELGDDTRLLTPVGEPPPGVAEETGVLARPVDHRPAVPVRRLHIAEVLSLRGVVQSIDGALEKRIHPKGIAPGRHGAKCLSTPFRLRREMVFRPEIDIAPGIGKPFPRLSPAFSIV